MIPIQIQQFPRKPSRGAKYKTIQSQLSNNQKFGYITKKNRDTPAKCHRRQQPNHKTGLPPMVYSLSTLGRSTSCTQNHIFCFQPWPEYHADTQPPMAGGCIHDISGYRVIDSNNKANAIVLDDTDGTFVVDKLSKQKATLMGGKRF